MVDSLDLSRKAASTVWVHTSNLVWSIDSRSCTPQIIVLCCELWNQWKILHTRAPVLGLSVAIIMMRVWHSLAFVVIVDVFPKYHIQEGWLSMLSYTTISTIHDSCKKNALYLSTSTILLCTDNWSAGELLLLLFISLVSGLWGWGVSKHHIIIINHYVILLCPCH